MKISKLYGELIESEDKKIRGTILGISCVNGGIEGFYCCDERDREFFACADGARYLADKVVFGGVKKDKSGFGLRLGLAAYSDSGKFLGHLEDCTSCGNRIKSAVIGKKSYPFHRLVFGDAVIVKSVNYEKACAEATAKNMFIDAVCGGNL